MHCVHAGRNTRRYQQLREVFEHNSASITLVENLNELSTLIDSVPVDGIVIDCLEGDFNPADMIRYLRPLTPAALVVIVHSDDELNRVLSLELGADDCLTQQFSPRELLARLRAVVRRSLDYKLEREGAEVLRKDGIELYRGRFRVLVDGHERKLTGAEFRLLERLLLADGNVVSREELAAHALGRELPVEDRSVDVHISRLRRKLRDRPDGTRRIHSVRGRGYLLSGD